MNRFFLTLRKIYNSKRIVFVICSIAFCFFMYFAPYSIFNGATNTGYTGCFSGWTYLKYFIKDIPQVYWLSVVPPLVLFTISIVSCLCSLRYKYANITILPFCAYCIFASSQNISDSPTSIEIIAYPVFYLITVLLFTLSIASILLACCLPIKEPAPRQPRPHKPTKAERIAELERQVAELSTKNTDTD